MSLSLQLFSEDREGEEWARCIVCLMWAHTLCRERKVCVLGLLFRVTRNGLVPLKRPAKALERVPLIMLIYILSYSGTK
jgi:hypothetical protein